MWLTGQCGSTFGLWLASPAEGCPGRRRGLGIGRRRRPGMGMVGGRAVWAAQVVTFDMSGLVWCKPGSWRAFRDAQVCCGWAGGQRRLSRSCHKRRETWWDGSRCAETISADQREGRDGLGRVTHGFSLTGGQVVAGSNPVSPTKSRQVKCYFYLLPKLTHAGALDSESTTARNRRILAWRKTGPDLRVLSRVRRPDGRGEFSASCDTHVGRRRPRIPFTRRNKPLNRAFPAGRDDRS